VRQRILLVENDPTILDSVAETLSATRYRVSKARDGLAALDAFRKNPFDLMILEIVLPKIDGHDLCRLIRQDERGRKLPIIVFTALAPEDAVKLADLGADAYVAKGPLSVVIPNILKATQSLLTGRQGRVGPQRIFGYKGFRPRQMVSELLSLKQYYQHLVHTLAEVVIEVDPQAKILSANPGALRLLGRPETEVVGLPFPGLLTPPDGTKFEALRKELSQDHERGTGVVEVTLADTRRHLRCRPVFDKGKISGFLVTAGSPPFLSQDHGERLETTSWSFQ
jgi:PAS domain S-box-containing protein